MGNWLRGCPPRDTKDKPLFDRCREPDKEQPPPKVVRVYRRREVEVPAGPPTRAELRSYRENVGMIFCEVEGQFISADRSAFRRRFPKARDGYDDWKPVEMVEIGPHRAVNLKAFEALEASGLVKEWSAAIAA
jgi:hypothetical protein